MRTFTPPKCESCISYDHIKCSCREELTAVRRQYQSAAPRLQQLYWAFKGVCAEEPCEEMVQGAHDGRYERQ